MAWSTGRGSRPQPALLKCTTVSQPGVSARRRARSRSGSVGAAIALSLAFMFESSTIAALANALRAEIAALAPGDRLPSNRELMRRHGVSPATVARAVATLAA